MSSDQGGQTRSAAARARRPQPRTDWERRRRRAYFLLESDGSPDPGAIAVRYGLIAVVVVNVLVALAATDDRLRDGFGPVLLWVELVTLVIFAVEYAARVWSCVEHPRYRGMRKWKARLRYAVTPAALVDAFVILPLAAAPFVALDLTSFVFLRIVRLLKLFRYSGGMAALAEAIFAERRALIACAVILVTVVLLSATSITYAERAGQPDDFGSVLKSLWWAIVTITTVGYGDSVPETPLGRAIAVITMVVGFAFIALPTAILSSSFAEVIRRRDFTITWGMIGRVPAFAGLDAATIVRIMPRLVARSFNSGDIVVHSHETPADLFIVVFGTLEAPALPPEPADAPTEEGDGPAAPADEPPVLLGEGDMFGGPLSLERYGTDGPLVATVPTRVLILPEDDLMLISRRRPDVYSKLIGEAATD
ncbi:cyclic nucleotide-gated ion channel [Amorphus orientalis]|uniref:Voltage-gated potassium channel n=1 Tax=Amorphus orientalis TaxID=649198 RepID=A0AAE4ATQ1_9HYPH|nr:cyclic nucleotide-gated ion channel [Amorphus orientalis]MDQ0317516.1 voltage-gated potassium channel [Amorphus orientalis]